MQSLGLPLRRARHARHRAHSGGRGGGGERTCTPVGGGHGGGCRKPPVWRRLLLLLGGFILDPNTSALTRQRLAGVILCFSFFRDNPQMGRTTDNGQERGKDGGAGTWGVSGRVGGRSS